MYCGKNGVVQVIICTVAVKTGSVCGSVLKKYLNVFLADFLNLLKLETTSFMKNAVFWNVAPCRYFVNRRWRRYVPPKRQLTQDLHGAASQNTVFFIVTSHRREDLKFYR
jgi:hypothetical protein